MHTSRIKSSKWYDQYAASNWMPADEVEPSYLKEHREELFLVTLDRGRNVGVEYDTMLGKHIALRLSTMGTSLHLPRIITIARIFQVDDAMLKEVYDGSHAPRLR